MVTSKWGVQQQLASAVFLSVFLTALAICATLFFFSQKRLYQDTVRQSEEMIDTASLAFSQAMADSDEALLDGFLHELQSRKELYIQEAYVLKPEGRVVAHSRVEEYGKTYPLPGLLTQSQPSSLSEVLYEEQNVFRVVSLLQVKGNTGGALIVVFSTQHLAQNVQSEMLWITGVTVPILLLSGFGVIVYGRRIANRLKRLQVKALAIGRGDWGEQMEGTGSDEISQLTSAFNQMRIDLSGLQAKDRKSAETIEALNRDSKAQLTRVEQLKEQLAEENAVLREELRSLYTPGQIIGANGSLRNEGKPGKTPVKILGGWKRKKDKEFTLLSKLTKEIELKQTAVVIIPLEPLGPVPSGKPSLELLVMAGSRETDQTTVHMP